VVAAAAAGNAGASGGGSSSSSSSGSGDVSCLATGSSWGEVVQVRGCCSALCLFSLSSCKLRSHARTLFVRVWAGWRLSYCRVALAAAAALSAQPAAGRMHSSHLRLADCCAAWFACWWFFACQVIDLLEQLAACYCSSS
jgi:hypothetical protein